MNTETLTSALIRHEDLMLSGARNPDPGREFYFAFPLKDPSVIVLCEALEQHIRSGMKALDLGSGFGGLCIAVSLLGVEKVYGIDASRYLVEKSNTAVKQMEEAGLLRPRSCQFFLGNYFPDDFPVDLRVKWDDWSEGPTDLQEVDPYREMGFTLFDFDIVFMYQYERNARETLELISQRCKPGSLIVAISVDTNNVPSNLQMILHKGRKNDQRLEETITFFRVGDSPSSG